MLTDTADDDKPVNQSTYQLVNQHVKELQNLGATYNVALFFSFIHMLLKKIKHYP